MKRWPCVALAWVGVAGLLLALCPPHVGMGGHRHLLIACGSPSLGAGTAPAWLILPGGTTASLEPGEPNTARLDSLAVPMVFSSEGDAGPPSLDTRGPPGIVQRSAQLLGLSGEADSPKQSECTPPPDSLGWRGAAPKTRVLQQPLVSR